MDHVLSIILGVPRLQASSSARSAVMKEIPTTHNTPTLTFIRHRDSMLCMKIPAMLVKVLDDADDDTADTSSTSSSSSGNLSAVSFAEPLVTAIHVRPPTTWEEKRRLYYSDGDYRSFRKDFYLYGRKEPRDSLVSFSDSVVTSVHTYPLPEDKNILYYSESDLKQFLEDFVSSLNET